MDGLPLVVENAELTCYFCAVIEEHGIHAQVPYCSVDRLIWIGFLQVKASSSGKTIVTLNIGFSLRDPDVHPTII
jgi:hypothetical protein